MSNELAVRTQGVTLRTVDDVARIAEMMASSGYFKDARDAAQAGVKIMAGQGWGIQPFDAMNGIHVISGKPAIGAGLMAAKVKGSGKYDYRVRQMTPEVCEIEFFQGGESIGVSSFTIEEARAAGTQNLNKFPRNMLFARAMSNGVKWFAPDVFSSPVYVPEELGAAVDEQGDIIDVPSRPQEPQEPTRSAEAEEPPTASVEAPSTKAQRQAMGIAMRERFGDKEEGKQQARAFFSHLAGRAEAVGSATEFTLSEASEILDRLGSGENGKFQIDEKKLTAALDEWHLHLDAQTTPLPDFDPNAKPSKARKAMKPITDDEAPADLRQEVPVEEQQEAVL